MVRPRILVSGPRRGGRVPRLLTRATVAMVGGWPRAVRPPLRTLRWEGVGGVIIGGGADIDPQRYHQEPRVEARLDPARDELEYALIAGALERGLPLLGICRGAQLLNVHCGGTLHQDLREVFPEHSPRRQLFARKRIDVEPHTRLASALGRRHLRVNSLHRQGVHELGEGIVVSARDHLGVIQGIERPAGPFCVGVQWHPELLPNRRSQRRLFRSLVRAARRPGT